MVSESKQPELYAALITTNVLAALAVSMRFLSRRLSRFKWWYDDWLILAAFVCAVGWMVDTLVWMTVGLGVHYETVDMPYDKYLTESLIHLFDAEIYYTMVAALAKLSILSFYWRIFGRSTIRLPIKIVYGLVVGWVIGRIFAIIFHCIPVDCYWKKCENAKCVVKDREFFMATNTLNVIYDVMILAMPMPYIKQLQMKRSQKLIVFAIFIFGGLITVSSTITTVVCFRFDDKDPDFGWAISDIMLWAGVELNMAVVCACLPSLRPVFLLFTRGRGARSRGSKLGDSSAASRSRIPSIFKSKSRTADRSLDNDSSHAIVTAAEEEQDGTARWHTTAQTAEVHAVSHDVPLQELARDKILVHNEVHIDITSADKQDTVP